MVIIQSNNIADVVSWYEIAQYSNTNRFAVKGSKINIACRYNLQLHLLNQATLQKVHIALNDIKVANIPCNL